MNRPFSARACAAAVLGALVATSSVTAFEYKKFGDGIGGASRCGDNFVTGGEQCEPPNTSVCSSTCTIIEPTGGECPPAPDCPAPTDCPPPDCPAPTDCPPAPPPTDCPAPTVCPPAPDCPPTGPEPGCGNGVVEGDEECEPPSQGSCDAECKFAPTPPPDVPPPDVPSCGDLIVQTDAGEDCEPPSQGGCDANCKFAPTPPPDVPPPDVPDCGDNIVQPEAGEDCEPPSQGTCDANCKFVPAPPPEVPGEPDCGDLIVQPDAGEECEPPGVGDCGPDCKIIVPPPAPECGDLTVSGDEECEPPNVGNCDENCQITEAPPPDVPAPFCGDSIVTPPEECEPPSVGSCDANCLLIPEPFCGDGIVQAGEECDPPGEGDCQADCTLRTLVPRTPPPGCVTCEDKAGKPVQVTLTWACQGPPPSTVTGGGKKGGAAQYDPATGVAVFGSGGDSLGSQIDFEYDGVENSIHTSCSSEFGPGLRTFTSSQDKKCQNDCTCSGCFVVTDAVPEDGGEYCPFCNIEFLEQAANGLPIGR